MRPSGLHTRGNPRAARPVGPAMAIRKLKLAALREWERLERRIVVPGDLRQWRPLTRRTLVLAGKLGLLAVLPFFVLVRGRSEERRVGKECRSRGSSGCGNNRN